ncbi:MAG: methyltransferase domain-containing protein [Planctomycetaceae bacterium]
MLAQLQQEQELMSTNQNWNAERYQQSAAYVPELGKSLIDWLKPQVGERILDLGCGNGTLTLSLIEAGAEVTGIDADPSMIAAAQAKGIDAQLQSATDLEFDSQFDAVFSNAALHWIRPPEKVIASVYRALKPSGRFVAEFGGAGNVEVARTALVEGLNRRGFDGSTYDTWYFPTPVEYQALLERGGFEVQQIELYQRPTPIGLSARDWFKNFAGIFLEPIPVDERDAFLDELIPAVETKLPQNEQGFLKDYVRLRFVAVKQ